MLPSSFSTIPLSVLSPASLGESNSKNCTSTCFFFWRRFFGRCCLDLELHKQFVYLTNYQYSWDKTFNNNQKLIIIKTNRISTKAVSCTQNYKTNQKKNVWYCGTCTLSARDCMQIHYQNLISEVKVNASTIHTFIPKVMEGIQYIHYHNNMFDLNKRSHPHYTNKSKFLTSDLDIPIFTETLTAWYSSVTCKKHVSCETSLNVSTQKQICLQHKLPTQNSKLKRSCEEDKW